MADNKYVLKYIFYNIKWMLCIAIKIYAYFLKKTYVKIIIITIDSTSKNIVSS